MPYIFVHEENSKGIGAWYLTTRGNLPLPLSGVTSKSDVRSSFAQARRQ